MKSGRIFKAIAAGMVGLGVALVRCGYEAGGAGLIAGGLFWLHCDWE